jgi:hypothetical protein
MRVSSRFRIFISTIELADDFHGIGMKNYANGIHFEAEIFYF